MRAGQLRHRVTLHRKTEAKGDLGGVTNTWSAYATDVPAAVKPLQGRELTRAAQVHADVSHEVFMRYREDVRPSDRMEFNPDGTGDSSTLEIITVIRDERRRLLRLPCTERVE